MTTVADQIAWFLQTCGVQVMFSQCLPSRLVLACEDLGICQVTCRTENAGGAAADAYARVSHKIGVVCAQNGPAATLLVPPLAEALKASVPVLALVQEVERTHTDKNAFQEFDHNALFAGCTKWVRTIRERTRVADYLRQAITIATSGRPGPVVLMLPADLLLEDALAIEPNHAVALEHWPLDRPAAAAGDIAAAATMIAAAEAPLVIAGGGVHGADATGELARLQEQASLPVGVTTMGKGAIDERHPLSLGLVGNAMGARSLGHFTKPLIDRADLVLLVGTRTNQNGTDSWTLIPPNARVIHLDIDGSEVGRNYASTRLVGDAKASLQALADALSREDLAKRTAARPELENQIAAHRTARDRAVAGRLADESTPVRPERTLAAIAAAIGGRRACFVADASYASVWITSCLTAGRDGTRFITPRGLAGLGWGLPMAMGAKIARPDDPVVCLVGDGGFGHVWSELETMVREAIPVVLVVLNNRVLGFQRDAELVRLGRHTGGVHFGPVDHAAIANACGCHGVRISDSADLEPALRACLDAGQPAVIDVATDPDAYPPLTMFDGLDAVRERSSSGSG